MNKEKASVSVQPELLLEVTTDDGKIHDVEIWPENGELRWDGLKTSPQRFRFEMRSVNGVDIQTIARRDVYVNEYNEIEGDGHGVKLIDYGTSGMIEFGSDLMKGRLVRDGNWNAEEFYADEDFGAKVTNVPVICRAMITTATGDRIEASSGQMNVVVKVVNMPDEGDFVPVAE